MSKKVKTSMIDKMTVAGLAIILLSVVFINLVLLENIITNVLAIYTIFFVVGFAIAIGFSLIAYKFFKPSQKETKIVKKDAVYTNICVVCNGPLSPNDVVCPRCKVPLDEVGECSVCGKEVSRKVKVCEHCGAIFT